MKKTKERLIKEEQDRWKTDICPICNKGHLKEVKDLKYNEKYKGIVIDLVVSGLKCDSCESDFIDSNSWAIIDDKKDMIDNFSKLPSALKNRLKDKIVVSE